MKKTFSITLSILGIIAIVSMLLLRQADATILNQDFGIETLYGDPNLINDIFEISTVRQEGSNSFSRVVLTTGKAEITSISFDARHMVDDRQLENRELYRGTRYWERRWSNYYLDNFRMRKVWFGNYPAFAPDLYILNTTTGDFSIIPIETLSGWMYWDYLFIFENNGELFYIAVEDNQPQAAIYAINLTTERMEYQFSINKYSDIGGTWFATENGMYFYADGGEWYNRNVELYSHVRSDWNSATDEEILESSGNSLYMINFENRSFDSRPSPIGLHSPWMNGHWGDYVMIGAYRACNSDEPIILYSGVTLVNLEQGHRRVITDPISTSFNHYDEFMFYPTEYRILEDFLIGTGRSTKFTQDIFIYDLSTMEKIYHGRINIRRDQGLLESEWEWMGVRNFEINLR